MRKIDKTKLTVTEVPISGDVCYLVSEIDPIIEAYNRLYRSIEDAAVQDAVIRLIGTDYDTWNVWVGMQHRGLHPLIDFAADSDRIMARIRDSICWCKECRVWRVKNEMCADLSIKVEIEL